MPRPYRSADADALWALKEAFELTLATGTGDGAKETAYRDKLDESYRESYLAWVHRCVDADPRSVQVAERDGTLVGYVFVLPETMSHVWDAAVLNELYVADSQRGTDVADGLLEAALAVARDQDLPLDRIVLDVDPDNDRARSFYDRWGFEPWGEMVAREL
ncbi:N-acetyltransferase family protein [Halobacteriales archaeon Cl-PHB]